MVRLIIAALLSMMMASACANSSWSQEPSGIREAEQAPDAFDRAIAEQLGLVLIKRTPEAAQTLLGRVASDYLLSDGEQELTLSRVLAALLEIEPRIVIVMLDDHPAILEKWLGELERDVFVWEGDEPSPLGVLQHRLLHRLGEADVPPSAEDTRGRIRGRLEAIRPRVID